VGTCQQWRVSGASGAVEWWWKRVFLEGVRWGVWWRAPVSSGGFRDERWWGGERWWERVFLEGVWWRASGAVVWSGGGHLLWFGMVLLLLLLPTRRRWGLVLLVQ